jgi:hypothetical protein
MFTLYIGNNDEFVAGQAKKENSSAYLIDHQNVNIQHQGVAYTSLADLPTELELSKLFKQADIIVYTPPKNDHWSDGKGEKSIQKQITEHYLNIFSFTKDKKIVNFNAVNNLSTIEIPTVGERLSDNPHLWCVGCSLTLGTGVKENQRFSNLLSKKLNLPLVNVSLGGSSIFWACDQILKSDIRSGDTLVWGVTSPNRHVYYDQKIHHLKLDNRKKYNQVFDLKDTILNLSTDSNSIFLAVNQILQVVNVCRIKNIKLVLAGLLTGNDLASYLVNLNEYIHLEGQFGLSMDNKFIDIGTDPLKHPGPKMHQWYADKIYNKLAKSID